MISKILADNAKNRKQHTKSRVPKETRQKIPQQNGKTGFFGKQLFGRIISSFQFSALREEFLPFEPFGKQGRPAALRLAAHTF
ncbi:MAG: hypothetical protein ACLVLA_13895 [Acidaminococcus intestini]